MEKIIKVKGKNKEYTCYATVPSYLDEYKHINIILKKLRDLFNIWYPKDTINNIDYEVYLYEDNSFNAFATKKDSGYVIAFSSTCLQTILKNAEEVFSKKEILELFNLNDADEKTLHYYKSAIVDYMSWFIGLHEFTHILHGHCGNNLLNAENYLNINETKNLAQQILEMDADSSAVKNLAEDIIKTELKTGLFSTAEKRDMYIPIFYREITFLSFSLYNLFLLFANIKRLDFKTALNSLLKYDHPLPSIRIAYITPVILQATTYILKDEETKELFEHINNICVAYDRIFYAKGDFTKSLQAVAYTKKGAQHRVNLNNLWNDIIPELQKYAVIKLEEREFIQELPYFVDENGKFIKS